MNGDKITVQGETISQQFANRINATYNLEMLMAGTARQVMSMHDLKSIPELQYQAMETLTKTAHSIYPQLVEHPGFSSFYSEATPIDVLERSKIGSRPARRTGARKLSDLRAIPWVFSWNQARFNLTGWFTIGTALERLKAGEPEKWHALQEVATKWPFLYYMLIEVETSLLNSDTEIMNSFAELVNDESSTTELMELLLADRAACLQQISELFSEPLASRRFARLSEIERRRQTLTLLHILQISYLKKWRSFEDDDSKEAEAILQKLLVITNGIAGGLKSTG